MKTILLKNTLIVLLLISLAFASTGCAPTHLESESRQLYYTVGYQTSLNCMKRPTGDSADVEITIAKFDSTWYMGTKEPPQKAIQEVQQVKDSTTEAFYNYAYLARRNHVIDSVFQFPATFHTTISLQHNATYYIETGVVDKESNKDMHMMRISVKDGDIVQPTQFDKVLHLPAYKATWIEIVEKEGRGRYINNTVSIHISINQHSTLYNINIAPGIEGTLTYSYLPYTADSAMLDFHLYLKDSIALTDTCYKYDLGNYAHYYESIKLMFDDAIFESATLPLHVQKNISLNADTTYTGLGLGVISPLFREHFMQNALTGVSVQVYKGDIININGEDATRKQGMPFMLQSTGVRTISYKLIEYMEDIADGDELTRIEQTAPVLK